MNNQEKTWVLDQQEWGHASKHGPVKVLVVSRGSDGVADSEGPALYSLDQVDSFLCDVQMAALATFAASGVVGSLLEGECADCGAPLGGVAMKDVRENKGRRRSRDTSAEAAHTPECQHPPRLPDEPRGYLAWHAWAEEKVKTHHQEFCDHCKRYAIWKPGSPRADS